MRPPSSGRGKFLNDGSLDVSGAPPRDYQTNPARERPQLPSDRHHVTLGAQTDWANHAKRFFIFSCLWRDRRRGCIRPGDGRPRDKSQRPRPGRASALAGRRGYRSDARVRGPAGRATSAEISQAEAREASLTGVRLFNPRDSRLQWRARSAKAAKDSRKDRRGAGE